MRSSRLYSVSPLRGYSAGCHGGYARLIEIETDSDLRTFLPTAPCLRTVTSILFWESAQSLCYIIPTLNGGAYES